MQSILSCPALAKHITIAKSFNGSLLNLPAATHITFDEHLPYISTLISITFATDFNCPVDDLPPSLQQITFSLYLINHLITFLPKSPTFLY